MPLQDNQGTPSPPAYTVLVPPNITFNVESKSITFSLDTLKLARNENSQLTRLAEEHPAVNTPIVLDHDGEIFVDYIVPYVRYGIIPSHDSLGLRPNLTSILIEMAHELGLPAFADALESMQPTSQPVNQSSQANTTVADALESLHLTPQPVNQSSQANTTVSTQRDSSPTSNRSYLLFVKMCDGTTFEPRNLTPQTPIRDVMDQIYQHTDMPVAMQRLIFAGKQLLETKTLADSRVLPESTIHLVGRMKGD